METRILSQEDIRCIALHVGLDALMDAMIERLHEALLAFRAEETVVFQRQGFRYDHPEMGLLEWMPCRVDGGRATIKIVGYHPSNVRRSNLPTILGTISEYDTTTGHLTCIMDGTLVTALRTGAASAVATSILARPTATTLGLLGAGAQAITQLHAVSRVLPIHNALVFDRNPAVLASFTERAAPVAGNVHIEAAPLDEIVRSADVLCTATSVGIGEGPLFDGIEPKPWIHINAVGSDFPGKVELPVSLLKRSFVCPDSREQAAVEGECQQLGAPDIGPSLYELVQSRDRFLPMQQRISVFDSTGWALEDHVALNLFVEIADKLGLGTPIAIETISDDALNPYDFLRPRTRVHAFDLDGAHV